jgi:acyl-CoA reductase-like NAD-dependent aldehyde dehydrogenase
MPMGDSYLPGGTGEPGQQRPAAKARPGEVWGRMPPKEREKILQSLQRNFPARYRQLIEQYYTELGKEQ